MSDMPLHHSAMAPDDLADRRSVRFHMRGPDDLVECFISWDALAVLEGEPGASTATRLAHFEMHRPRIEAAVLAKYDGDDSHSITLDAADIRGGPDL